MSLRLDGRNVDIPKEWAGEDLRVPKRIKRKWKRWEVHQTCMDAVDQPLSVVRALVGIKMIPVGVTRMMTNLEFVSMLVDGMVKSEMVPLMAVLTFILTQYDVDDNGMVRKQVPFPVVARYIESECESHAKTQAKIFLVDALCFTEAFAIAMSNKEMVMKMLTFLKDEDEVTRNICVSFFRGVSGFLVKRFACWCLWIGRNDSACIDESGDATSVC